MPKEVNPFTRVVFKLTDEYRNRVKVAEKAKPIPFMKESASLSDAASRYNGLGSPKAKKDFMSKLEEKDKRKLIGKVGIDRMLRDTSEAKGFGGGNGYAP